MSNNIDEIVSHIELPDCVDFDSVRSFIGRALTYKKKGILTETIGKLINARLKHKLNWALPFAEDYFQDYQESFFVRSALEFTGQKFRSRNDPEFEEGLAKAVHGYILNKKEGLQDYFLNEFRSLNKLPLKKIKRFTNRTLCNLDALEKIVIYNLDDTSTKGLINNYINAINSLEQEYMQETFEDNLGDLLSMDRPGVLSLLKQYCYSKGTSKSQKEIDSRTVIRYFGARFNYARFCNKAVMGISKELQLPVFRSLINNMGIVGSLFESYGSNKLAVKLQGNAHSMIVGLFEKRWIPQDANKILSNLSDLTDYSGSYLSSTYFEYFMRNLLRDIDVFEIDLQRLNPLTTSACIDRWLRIGFEDGALSRQILENLVESADRVDSVYDQLLVLNGKKDMQEIQKAFVLCNSPDISDQEREEWRKGKMNFKNSGIDEEDLLYEHKMESYNPFIPSQIFTRLAEHYFASSDIEGKIDTGFNSVMKKIQFLLEDEMYLQASSSYVLSTLTKNLARWKSYDVRFAKYGEELVMVDPNDYFKINQMWLDLAVASMQNAFFHTEDAVALLQDLKIPLEQSGTLKQNEKYVHGLIKSVADPEEIKDCLQLSFEEHLAIKRAGRGAWSDVYVIIRKGVDNPYWRKVIKVTKRNIRNNDAAYKIVEKMHGESETLERLQEQERLLAESCSTLGIGNSLGQNYKPLPDCFGLIDFKKKGEPRKGLSYSYIEGVSFDEYFERDISLEAAITTIQRAAYAVNFLHTRGICHNDLKGDNLIVGNNGLVYIFDLGFARFVGEKSSEEQFNLQSMKGSRLYTAPERITGGSLSSFKADQYSFGVMVFKALTGEFPRSYEDCGYDRELFTFATHANDIKVKRYLLGQSYDFYNGVGIPNLNTDKCETRKIVYRELTGIVSKCLAQSPRRRHKSMQDVMMSLYFLEKKLRA